MLPQRLDALALAAAPRGNVDLDHVLERLDPVTEAPIDVRRQPRRVLQALRVHAHLVDQPLRRVVHAGDHVVLAGIVHLRENADVALHVQRQPVAQGVQLPDQRIRHVPVHTPLQYGPHVAVNDVRAAGGDVEVRLYKARDEGRQSAHLPAGAKAEQVPRGLVLAYLVHVLRRKLHVRLVEVQRPVKVAGKDFFHNGNLQMDLNTDGVRGCGQQVFRLRFHFVSTPPRMSGHVTVAILSRAEGPAILMIERYTTNSSVTDFSIGQSRTPTPALAV